MSINPKLVALEVRKRIVSASGIDPVATLKLQNTQFESIGKTLWIAEYIIGGKEQPIGNKRSRISSFLIQYDICMPKNTGTFDADSMALAIAEEFDLSSFDKSTICGAGFDANIKEIKLEVDDGKDVYRKIILLTLDVLST